MRTLPSSAGSLPNQLNVFVLVTVVDTS